MYKDIVQVKQKKSKIIINNNIEYNCKNSIEARKIIEQITTQKTGKNILERTTNKAINIGKPIKAIIELAALVKGAPGAIKTLKKSGKELIQILFKTPKR